MMILKENLTPKYFWMLKLYHCSTQKDTYQTNLLYPILKKNCNRMERNKNKIILH